MSIKWPCDEGSIEFDEWLAALKDLFKTAGKFWEGHVEAVDIETWKRTWEEGVTAFEAYEAELDAARSMA